MHIQLQFFVFLCVILCYECSNYDECTPIPDLNGNDFSFEGGAGWKDGWLISGDIYKETTATHTTFPTIPMEISIIKFDWQYVIGLCQTKGTGTSPIVKLLINNHTKWITSIDLATEDYPYERRCGGCGGCSINNSPKQTISVDIIGLSQNHVLKWQFITRDRNISIRISSMMFCAEPADLSLRLTNYPRGRLQLFLEYDKRWHTVCGHYFWNNNNGAITACQYLGYALGGEVHKMDRQTLDKDSIFIGGCKTGELPGHCTVNLVNCNMNDINCDLCREHSEGVVEVECSTMQSSIDTVDSITSATISPNISQTSSSRSSMTTSPETSPSHPAYGCEIPINDEIAEKIVAANNDDNNKKKISNADD